jgi:serine protease Do
MPRRREFLAAAGVAALGGLAGCTDSLEVGSGPPANEPTTETSTKTPTVTERPGNDGSFDATRIYRETIPSVVGIRVSDPTGPVATGSGFVANVDGNGPHVVTNEHVVAPGLTYEVRFQNNQWRDATVSGSDVFSDLAVLDPNDRPSAAVPLDLVGIDPEPPIGTEVIAIGSPFGLGGSASAGIISGVDRLLPAPNDFTIADAVQTDAALNPGNSGGPLVTETGQVAAVVTSAGGENIGFGISAALAKRVVPALATRGRYDHSFMGVRIQEVGPAVAQAYDLADVRGVLIVSVLSGGPSDDVLRGATGETEVNGLEVPTGGDVVVSMGGREIVTQADLSNFLTLETSPGDTIDVTVLRDGSRRTVQLELGERPSP